MKTYTFYFTIFGMKKKWQVDARSESAARVEFDDFISNSTNIDKIDEVVKHSNSVTSDFLKMFNDILGKG